MTLSGPPGAQLAAEFLIDRARRRASARWRQGQWQPPLRCGSSHPALRLLSSERVHRVPLLAVRALLEWADGRDVRALDHVPQPQHVLELQALGKRCVSLLPDDELARPHVDAFEFAVHDLCHLGKFFAPEHHVEQVGFFASFAAALSRPAFRELEAALDEQWRSDRDHVAADMNGSSVYLFAALKMKLKMAVRRSLAAGAGVEAPHGGALQPLETLAYEGTLELLLDAFGFDSALRAAARRTSTRRDCPLLAARLAQHFERVGSAQTRPPVSSEA